MAEALLDLLQPGEVERRVRDLPPLPQAVLEVLQVLRDDRLSSERCVRLIEQDPALAARTLRLANSAFYGAAGRVRRIGDAVSMLGLRTVSAALAAVSLAQAVPRGRCPHLAFDSYWRHAVATALAARRCAQHLGQDAEEAFLAGLVHDVGRLVLAAYFPEASAAVAARVAEQDCAVHEAEQALFGFDHGRVGAWLAQHWHFPDTIVAAIDRHHAPQPNPADGLSLDGLIHVADAMAHGLDVSREASEVVPLVAPWAWSALALDEGALLALFQRVEQDLADTCEALHL